MKLRRRRYRMVAIAALIAVCGAAKLDRTYLPPASAATAGGSSDSLQAPLTRTSEQGESSGNLPTGSYTNSFQGVVVDAAGADTRSSPDVDQSGLGGPRDAYGSQNSKVGEAAFRGSLAGFRNTQFGSSGFNGPVTGTNVEQNFGAFESKSERPQASKDRNSNIISYANDVSIDNYSYGFESDNGIAVGENGVANNGIQAQGGYSYKGDDGQVYKVTYVADEGGYRPQGDHLPTPPPIPKEILISLEKNAKDEAAGLIDDGSYDAQKYNAEGDYTHHNSGNNQYNGAQLSQFAKRPESDATASNTFINQNSQAFVKPGQFGNNGAQNGQSTFNGQSNQLVSNFANNQNGFVGSQQPESSQTLNGQKENSSAGQVSGQLGQSSGSQLTHFGQGLFGSQSSLGHQNDKQAPVTQFGTQTSQFNSHSSSQPSKSQSGVHSTQFGSQQQQFGFTSQLNSQSNEGSASSFGVHPNNLSFGTQSAINSQQNQFNNQAFKPQSNFGAAEYLPPFTANKKPSYNKPQVNVVPAQESNKDNQPLKGQQRLPQDSSASSFVSLGSADIQPQTSQTFTGFQNQPSRPNQFNLNNVQSGSNVSPISSQNSGSNVSPGSDSGAKPTSVPSIELTTPLEPHETSVFSQGSQINSQSNPSTGTFGSQSLNNQAQLQTNFQHSATAAQQHTSQTLSPSFSDSRPQGTSEFGSSSPAPSAFPTTQRPGTQKPSFSQGPDDSYYYNQPSKPFGTPGARPQGSSFPNTPSYQSNGVASLQSHQIFNQQGSQSSFNNLPSSQQLNSVAPTLSSQFTQAQGSLSTSQYNGITQASISPFPSVSPTTSTQYDTTQSAHFGSKPNIPSFPTKPVASFGQSQSTLFTQNQFGQSVTSNNNLLSASQSAPSKPSTTFAQTSFTQSQTQLGQDSQNNKQPQNSETNQEQGVTSTQTQQYEGTVYEYNKPPEVLPAPEQSDSSSSQSIQTNLSSKPEEGQEPNTQDTQSGQNSISSQKPSFNQGIKPQYGSQTFKPFGDLQSGQNQLGQNTQSTVSQQNIQGQNTVQSSKPNASTLSSTSNQLSQVQQGQFGYQSSTTFGTAASHSQFGQNVQETTQNGVNSFKPFGGGQSTTLFGQNTQSNFGSVTQQTFRPQFSAQANKPFGSASDSSQLGQATHSQNSQNIQQQTGTPGSISSSGSQNSYGYPSSKPQFGNQLTLPQFSQTSQQNFGSTQLSSHPQADALPAKPFGNAPTIGQGTNQPSESFQQSFQSSQFGSVASKPQFGVQPQFGQTQNIPVPPFSSASSQAQVGPNSAQASSSGISQPSGTKAYKPFGAPTNFNIPSQNKPQFDQAPQSSAVSTTSSPQLSGQSFGNSQVSQIQAQGSQFHSSPCCKSINKDSAIAPLNIGKPSQAFAQTQSQFTGFPGVQFNAQSLAGKGEEFGGPRQPPSFDAETGYHY